jgi:hypothetical protein
MPADADRSDVIFTLGFVRDAIVFVLGIYWCRRMFRRLRRDIDTLYDSRQTKDWAVIGGLWGVTVFVVVFLIVTSVGVIRSIGHA